MFKKSVVLKANKLKPIAGVSPDYKTVIFFTLFVCGLIIGVTVISQSGTDFTDFFSKIIHNNISAKKDSSWFKCFCGEFVWLFILVFVDFICGLCGVGLPFIWLIPICFGCFAGMVLALFFINYGMTGLGYCALMNIPSYAITAATLVKCCCESTKVSNEIFFYILSGSKGDTSKTPILKEYTVKYIFFCIPVIIAALISTGSFKLFSGLFSFV